MSLLSLMKTSTAKTPKGYLKALTVHQPYASLIWLLLKKNETRGWSTRYRGPIAIHAGMRKMKPGDYTPSMVQALVPHFIDKALDTEFDIWPYGVVVGIFELHGSVPSWQFGKKLPPLSDFERHVGFYGPGRFAWQLKPIVVFNKPVPIKGSQGLWHVREDLFPEWMEYKAQL